MVDVNGCSQDGMTTNKKDPKEEKPAEKSNSNGSAVDKKEENKEKTEQKGGLRQEPKQIKQDEELIPRLFRDENIILRK